MRVCMGDYQHQTVVKTLPELTHLFLLSKRVDTNGSHANGHASHAVKRHVLREPSYKSGTISHLSAEPSQMSKSSKDLHACNRSKMAYKEDFDSVRRQHYRRQITDYL